MLDIPRIVVGLLFSTLIGGFAYRRRSLTRGGWLGAILTGTSTFGFGGWSWGLTLIAFFVTSSALSHFRQAHKQRIAGEKFEKGGQRDLWQALANGGAGGVLALAYGLMGESWWLLAAFAGVMATVTADTWATELGVLSPNPPRLVTTWQRVAPGTSGGISRYGFAASVAGALFIGVVMLVIEGVVRGAWQGWLVPAALLGGLMGSLADSWLGAVAQAMYRTPTGEETERRYSAGAPNELIQGFAWMNNDLVNCLSSLFGGLIAFAVAWLLIA